MGGTRIATEVVEVLQRQRQPSTKRKGLRRKGLPIIGEGLRAMTMLEDLVATVVVLTRPTTMMTADGRQDDDGTAARRRGGVGSVALLHDLAQGGYSARNPTVGIAAL